MRLQLKLVQAARDDAIAKVPKHKVWIKVPRAQVKPMGKGTIRAKWVDTTTDGEVSPRHRSRLVAKEL